MPQDDGFDAMTAACIAAHEAVRKHGSRELRTAADLLLLALGREIAVRTGEDLSPNDGEA